MVGSSSAPPQGSGRSGRPDAGVLTPLIPHVAGRVLAMGKPQDTVPRVGERSMRCRTAGAGSEVPRPARRPEPSGSSLGLRKIKGESSGWLDPLGKSLAFW